MAHNFSLLSEFPSGLPFRAMKNWCQFRFDWIWNAIEVYWIAFAGGFGDGLRLGIGCCNQGL